MKGLCNKFMKVSHNCVNWVKLVGVVTTPVISESGFLLIVVLLFFSYCVRMQIAIISFSVKEFTSVLDGWWLTSFRRVTKHICNVDREEDVRHSRRAYRKHRIMNYDLARNINVATGIELRKIILVCMKLFLTTTSNWVWLYATSGSKASDVEALRSVEPSINCCCSKAHPDQEWLTLLWSHLWANSWLLKWSQNTMKL